MVVREVPKGAPLTKIQHKEWNEHWPTVFNQNDFQIVKHSKKESKFLSELVKSIGDSDLILFTFEGELLRCKGGCPQHSIMHGVIRLLENWPESEPFKSRKHNTRNL